MKKILCVLMMVLLVAGIVFAAEPQAGGVGSKDASVRLTSKVDPQQGIKTLNANDNPGENGSWVKFAGLAGEGITKEIKGVISDETIGYVAIGTNNATNYKLSVTANALTDGTNYLNYSIKIGNNGEKLTTNDATPASTQNPALETNGAGYVAAPISLEVTQAQFDAAVASNDYEGSIVFKIETA